MILAAFGLTFWEGMFILLGAKNVSVDAHRCDLAIGWFQKINVHTYTTGGFLEFRGQEGSLHWKSKGMKGTFAWNSLGIGGGGVLEGTG